MGARRNHLTWDEHQALGNELHELRDRLVRIEAQLATTYGADAPATRLAEQGQATVDALRSELERLVGEDCPGQPAEARFRCYYPISDEAADG